AILSGQPLKTSVQSGLSMAQIGEFSFIIAAQGEVLKVTSDFLYPIAVAVSAVTTFVTPYLIKFSEPIYFKLEKVLPDAVKNAISGHANKLDRYAGSSRWQQYLRSWLMNTVLLTVIVIAIGVLSALYLLPFITKALSNKFWASLIGVVVTI